MWGAKHSAAAVDALAEKQLDLVIAADACYDDQVACTCCACRLQTYLCLARLMRCGYCIDLAGWQDAKPRGFLHHLPCAVQS